MNTTDQTTGIAADTPRDNAPIPAAPLVASLTTSTTADAAETCELQLDIDGMSCASCSSRVERALNALLAADASSPRD